MRTTILAPLGLAAVLALGSCGTSTPTAPSAGTTPPRPSPVEAEYLEYVAVVLAPGADGSALAAAYGATVMPGSDDEFLLLEPASSESCPELALRMQGDPAVVAVERNSRTETAETRQEAYASDDGNGTFQTYSEQAAAQAVGLDGAHLVSTGNGVVVAVLDTGIDPTHPVFAGRLVPGYDFVDRDADPTDLRDFVDNDLDGRTDEAWGHGTHVGGIVALAAPGAQLMPVRVLDADGFGTVVTVAAGIRWAVEHGARVLNLSLGMLHGSDAIQNELDAAEEQGVVVVCSAGNWGAEEPREYPATSSHALAIAATDAEARAASFSSFGGHVDLSAPGVGVRSAYPGGGYRLWSGTSMSAPFVAGTAALLLELRPGWNESAVFDRLARTSRGLVGLSGDRRDKFGAGMLDAARAVTALPAP